MIPLADFEDAIVRHVRRLSSGDSIAHVLCHHAYYARQAEAIIRQHFPTLDVGGPIEELPWLEANRSKDPVQALRPVMVGSISGICFMYLRARLSSPSTASQFGKAIALVINYDADVAGRCFIGSFENPIDSIRVDEFLSVYKDVTHVRIEFPPATPRWDFETDRPVY